MATDNALDVLRAARALVRKGWCQGFTHIGTKYCAAGALGAAAAAIGYDAATPTYLLARRLADSLVPGGANLVGWNDAAGRKKREVIALFDRAIAWAEMKDARGPR